MQRTPGENLPDSAQIRRTSLSSANFGQNPPKTSQRKSRAVMTQTETGALPSATGSSAKQQSSHSSWSIPNDHQRVTASDC